MPRYQPGESFELTREVDRYRPIYYAGAAGDFNPIHIDPEVGRMAGLGGNILQGLCTLAWAVDAFARYLGDPGAVTRVRARFSRPVALEDTLVFRGKVTAGEGGRLRAAVRAENQRGEEVLKEVEVEGWNPTEHPRTSTGQGGTTPEPRQVPRSHPEQVQALPSGGAVTPSSVGRRWGPFHYTVGLEKMREYVAAISGGAPILGLGGLPDDVHPVLHDTAAAAAGPYRSVIGFPTFAVTFAMAPFGAAMLDPALGVDLLRLVHGEQAFEFLEVLRPGDELTTHGELTEVAMRGRHQTLVVRTESVNQHGRVAVRGVFTGLIRG